MSTNKFTDEFKRDAVAQVVDRGYPVREVAERLGVSAPSRSILGSGCFRGPQRWCKKLMPRPMRSAALSAIWRG